MPLDPYRRRRHRTRAPPAWLHAGKVRGSVREGAAHHRRLAFSSRRIALSPWRMEMPLAA